MSTKKKQKAHVRFLLFLCRHNPVTCFGLGPYGNIASLPACVSAPDVSRSEKEDYRKNQRNPNRSPRRRTKKGSEATRSDGDIHRRLASCGLVIPACVFFTLFVNCWLISRRRGASLWRRSVELPPRPSRCWRRTLRCTLAARQVCNRAGRHAPTRPSPVWA